MPLLPLSNPVGASISGIAAGGGAANTALERTRNRTAREIIACIACSLPGVCRFAKRRLRRIAIIRRDGYRPGGGGLAAVEVIEDEEFSSLHHAPLGRSSG